MALPNPSTTPNGSKLFPLVYDNGGANAAACAKSVKQTTVNSETLGHMGVGTHKDTDTFASGDPVVLVAGINSTDIVPLAVNSEGEVGINDGGNSITIDGSVTVSSVGGTVTVGTHAVSQSGTWNVGLSAGTNTAGAVLDGGWDNAGKTVQRGLQQALAGDVAEKTLLSADAANLYNITDVVYAIYSGSTAPAAVRRLQFRVGAAGTVFHTEYVPPTANYCITRDIHFKEPVRSTTNQAVTVQLDGAGGTSYEYSAMVLAYKSAS